MILDNQKARFLMKVLLVEICKYFFTFKVKKRFVFLFFSYKAGCFLFIQYNVFFQCFIKLLFTKVKSLMKIEILQHIPVRSFGILFLIALLCNSLIFFRNLSSMVHSFRFSDKFSYS